MVFGAAPLCGERKAAPAVDNATGLRGSNTNARTIKAVVVPADPSESIRLLQLEDPDYKTYQSLVSGLIEFIDIPHSGTLCGNDEAKLSDLPFNIRATSLLYLVRPEYIGQDFLSGDFVVLGEPDDDGETQSCPELYVQLLVPP